MCGGDLRPVIAVTLTPPWVIPNMRSAFTVPVTKHGYFVEENKGLNANYEAIASVLYKYIVEPC